MKVVQTPLCSSCGYGLVGLGELGSEVRCPECGHWQQIRSAPVDFSSSGFWFSSFFCGALPFACSAALIVALPIHRLRPLLLILALAAAAILAALRFSRRLVVARRGAGFAPDSALVQTAIVLSTAVLYGTLYALLVLIGGGVVAMAWGIIKI